MVFTCVLLAFPAALYVMVFALIRIGAGTMGGDRRADWSAAAAILLLGLGVLVWFHVNRRAPPAAEEIEAALSSGRWEQRIAALREFPERRLDIADRKGFQEMAESPVSQERYWLAKALAQSRKPAASPVLIRLLDDPDLNVRTMALEALGQRRERGALGEVLRRLQVSQDWYEQMYAYRALKNMGWKQNASP
jgi:HEAT repeat protein